MAKSIGSLFVEYRATADKYLADLKQMAKDSKEFERTIAPLKNQILDIGKGMAVVGGAVTTAFLAMSKQAANYGDAIRDASIRTGVSTQALSGLKFAAEQTGTSFEAINTGLIRMSRNSLAAAQGTKASEQAFKALGVSVQDSAGHLRNQDDILGDVAERFKQMKDGTEKAALAQQIFGRGGAQMIEFLNQGKEGLEAFNKQAREMGLEVLPEAAQAADEFNDSLNALQNAQLGLSNTIGQQLLPGLTRATNLVTGLIVEFRKFVSVHPEVTRSLFTIASIISGAGGLLLGMAGVLAILPKLTAAFAALTGPIGIAVLAIGAFVSAMVAFPKFRGIVVDVLKNVIGLFTLLGSQIGSIGQALLQLATGQFKTAWETISTSGAKSVDAMVRSLDTFDDAINSMGKALNFTANPLAETRQGLQDLGITLDDVGKKAKDTIQRIINANNAFIRQHLNDVEDVGRKWIDVMSDAYSKDLAAFIKSRQTILDIQDKNRGQLQKGLQEQLDQNGKWVDAMSEQYSKGLGEQIKDTEAKIDKIDKLNEKALEDFKRAQQQAIDDVKNSAGKIFDDMFIKGENVFSSLKTLLKGGALSLGRAIFEDIAGALLGPIKLAFDKFIKGLITGPVEALGKAISKRLATAFAEGAAGSAAGTAGSAAASAGAQGAASSAAGSVGASAGSLAGGLVSGGLAAAGAIIAAYINKGNFKAIEEQTRETRDWLEIMATAWNPLFNQMTAYQKGIYESIKGGAVLGNGRVGPGAADVRQGAAGSVTTIEAPFTFAPTFSINWDRGDLTDLEVRDAMDKMTVALDTGIRGYRERWAQILGASDSPGTPVPVGA